ncbi:single-stranded DNA-binding protein [Campylobacter sp. RM10532]|uniref:Single-stranded DNA-binding protein n=1 Tax=Campylobacter molothri TaxID=1032242 RepID=A0ACC5W2F5_9BACT|nr:single-stranded DNA-binding protein [Campylobacter sp. RM10537]MBZ7928670.1 single-stranded DNA-binding protein [Campylobacter sp. RM10542]MBZ7930160.1 single-stranded DNA-binding protein [Campylobacter sp. W0067]MBZ7931637.1 single-stranded DNA-binding protein [Campylobacter sp. RM12910]MBZ7933040.1 single-stranded DNA-binding protein [Campylobacter sp. RM10543]MBZ7934624.1 single-stranded DNA-binding protein [Campylobacter sp. W0065]MBZ7937667.1 single-stranded DNA-binding protein [Campy
MFNKVVLVGNLTRNIEMRYGQNGNAIGASAIAVTRRFTANGEKREETCFIDISFYGRTAEIANQYLTKGSKILIEGRLRFEQWSDQNGQNRSKHSIQVENMEMLGANNTPQNSGNFSNGYANYENQSYDPYAGQNNFEKTPQKMQNSNQNQEKIKEIDVDAYDSDDTDLPF